MAKLNISGYTMGQGQERELWPRDARAAAQQRQVQERLRSQRQAVAIMTMTQECQALDEELSECHACNRSLSDECLSLRSAVLFEELSATDEPLRLNATQASCPLWRHVEFSMIQKERTARLAISKMLSEKHKAAMSKAQLQHEEQVAELTREVRVLRLELEKRTAEVEDYKQRLLHASLDVRPMDNTRVGNRGSHSPCALLSACMCMHSSGA